MAFGCSQKASAEGCGKTAVARLSQLTMLGIEVLHTFGGLSRAVGKECLVWWAVGKECLPSSLHVKEYPCGMGAEPHSLLYHPQWHDGNGNLCQRHGRLTLHSDQSCVIWSVIQVILFVRTLSSCPKLSASSRAPCKQRMALFHCSSGLLTISCKGSHVKSML